MGVTKAMITVRSFDRPAEWALFDPKTGELGPRQRGDTADGAGVYGEPAGVLVVLYRERGVLRLRLGKQDFVADGELEVHYMREGGRRVLTVGGTTLGYAAPDSAADAAEDPMLPFLEGERSDLGLFVVDVLGDPARMHTIYRPDRT
ncbi:hypothetical protein OHS70_08185 [Streptomyces sp. NBC_00390]|uniref:hypothetical protein n=1 Tax=Streptomyces sp. NBC_00390 TaxID=2975736 RepID=UPI002E1AB5BD